MLLGQSQPLVPQSNSSLSFNHHQTSSSTSPVSNIPSFEQSTTKQDDLEQANYSRVLPQQQIQQSKQHFKFISLKDNLGSLNKPKFSQIVQRIRPAIMKKIKEITERKSKEKEMLCQRTQNTCNKQSLRYKSKWQDNCKAGSSNPIKRYRQVTFSQVIAVKRFISCECPSILAVAVEYHQGLNVKQKHEPDPSNLQQQNNQASATPSLRKNNKPGRKVTKKMVGSQK